jgi:hypothetical protein
METSASSEARYAPWSYPTNAGQMLFPGPFAHCFPGRTRQPLWLEGGKPINGGAVGRSATLRQVKGSLSRWLTEWRIRVADFCRTMRQINTSASSTLRSAKSNPIDALQTC